MHTVTWALLGLFGVLFQDWSKFSAVYKEEVVDQHLNNNCCGNHAQHLARVVSGNDWCGILAQQITFGCIGALLQELTGLKEIDSQKRARTRQEKAARQERQRRRREIHTQIRELGEAKRNEAEQNFFIIQVTAHNHETLTQPRPWRIQICNSEKWLQVAL
jgi:hypothetical protein